MIMIHPVVVVNKQMPWDGLSWGQCVPREPEEGRMEIELTQTYMNTGDIPRFRALVRR